MEPNWPPNAVPSHPRDGRTGGSDRRKRIALIVTLLVLIAGLATAAGLVLIDRDDDTATADYIITATPPTAPVFEPRGVEGNDPFFPLEAQVASFERDKLKSGDGTADSGDATTIGDDDLQTGLYGGTAENTCDPERLISYLYDHPDKGVAWAEVQGIAFNEIGSYIRSLDARVLAQPAVVLNHGFDYATGTAYEIETTLDAGTAVLVDADGDIRVRCYCGNPVKPKPPAHRPPRCLILTSLVFTTPGGSDPRSGVTPAVVLTGQVATGGDDTWSEVSWGANDTDIGWTPDLNLQNGYCDPILDPGSRCAGPGAVPVWGTPAPTQEIGRLGGEVRTADTTVQIAASVYPAGGEQAVLVENGFLLIEFTRAAAATSESAWVRTSDLAGQGCTQVTACVDTEGPVKDRAGGFDIRPSGTYRVNFTGHFAAIPVSSAEVHFADGTGTGWISNVYTPVGDDQCHDDGRLITCARGETGVYTGSDVESTELLAIIFADAPVILIDGSAQVSGRVNVQVGAGGPNGWVDAEALDPVTPVGGSRGACGPFGPFCAVLTAPAFSDFPDSGFALPGTPAEAVIHVYPYSVRRLDAPHSAPYASIVIDGRTGWISSSDLMLSESLGCEGVGEVLPPPTAEATVTPAGPPTPAPTAVPTSPPAPTSPAAPGPTTPPAPQPTARPTTAPTAAPTPTPSCPDSDGDGICNANDNCRADANPDQADLDDDGKGDVCDTCTDVDRDFHCDNADNCPEVYDPGQADSDKDGVGDVCDSCPLNPQVTTGSQCGGAPIRCEANSYVGVSKSVALSTAERNTCRYRLVREDDQSFNVTRDFVPDRLNFEVDNGIVTRVTLG